MPGYTNVFGNTSVNQADPSYRSVALTADVELVWPRFNYNDGNNVAAIMDVTADASTWDIALPDATLASPGTSMLFYNVGANSFNVTNNDGSSTIASIPTTQAVYIWLKTNTTANGTWGAVQFAVGSASVTAAALAGAGLQALGGLLTTAWPAISTSTTPLTISTTTHRSTLINWTGGAGTFNLPAGTSNDGFFFSVKNSGSGQITLDMNGADTIDGFATKTVSVGESFIVVCDGTEWFTVGNRLLFSATYIEINVAGSGDYTVPVTEQGYLIYKLTGVLTGARAVKWPAAVNQLYVNNATTGAYALTISTTAAGGAAPTVTQNDQVVAYSDGTNMYVLQENTQLDEGRVALLAQMFG
jgi:hypothetical protein